MMGNLPSYSISVSSGRNRVPEAEGMALLQGGGEKQIIIQFNQ